MIIVFASNVGLSAHSGQQTYKIGSGSKPSDPFKLAFQRSSVRLLTGGWLLHSCKSFHIPGVCFFFFEREIMSQSVTCLLRVSVLKTIAFVF